MSINELEAKANNGDINAMWELAEAYFFAKDVEEDNERAFTLYKKIEMLDPDNPDVLNRLGRCYFKGYGTQENVSLALEYLKRAESLGSMYACKSLAEMYRDGIGVEQNIAIALKYLEKAVAADNDEALVMLGDMYHDGEGVEKNDTKATELYRRAADLDNSNGCYRFGMQTYNGWGVPVDKELAVKYWMKGAELTHWGCQLIIGNCYQNGDCVPKDMEKALYWLQQSADQGLADAHFELGKIYLFGQDTIEPNEEKAIDHLTIAAKADDDFSISAMNYLGDLYQQKKTSDGIEEALKWYDQAAEKGNFRAAHLAMLMSSIQASGAMVAANHSEYADGWEWALEDLNKCKKCLDREISFINSGSLQIEQKIVDEVNVRREANNYDIATCYYFLDRYQEVCQILGNSGSLRSRILFCASVLLGRISSEGGSLNAVLSEIENNQSYDPTKGGGYAEESAYAICMNTIADSHRNRGGKELENAVEVLDHTIRVIKDPKYSEALRKERNRYQSKLFGGYKYV